MVHAQRIALFLANLTVGGAQRVCVNLAGGLAERGAEVDLVVAGGGEAFLRGLDSRVAVVPLGAPRVLASLPGLIRYLRRRRPEVLLTTQLHANLVALWAARLSGIRPRIVVRQGNVLFRPGRSPGARFLVTLARRFYPSADAIVAVSRGVAVDVARILGVAPDDVTVIYNPVIGSALFEQASERLEHPWFEPGSPPVVVSAGRLTPQKDHVSLLRAFRVLRERCEGHLAIFGEGAERSRLEQLIRELGLGPDVWLAGAVDNPLSFMARAQACVLSSRWEGLPNVLIEALALGTPVIATDCHAGPREILDGGRYGELVPPDDPVALADGMLRVMRSPSKERPGPAYLGRFEIAACVDAYREVLGVRAA